jgi:hypothetical protein
LKVELKNPAGYPVSGLRRDIQYWYRYSACSGYLLSNFLIGGISAKSVPVYGASLHNIVNWAQLTVMKILISNNIG